MPKNFQSGSWEALETHSEEEEDQIQVDKKLPTGRQKGNSGEFRSGIINEQVKPEFCELKPEMGPCTGSFLRYFYNSSIDECSSFYYGGCDGNENNFHTLFACNAICQEPNTTEDDIIFKVSF